MQSNNERRKPGKNENSLKSFANHQSAILVKELQNFAIMLEQERPKLKNDFNDIYSNLEYLQNRLSRKIPIPQEAVDSVSRILKRSKINILIKKFKNFLELCKQLDYKIEIDPDYILNMQTFLDSQFSSSLIVQGVSKEAENTPLCISTPQNIVMEFDIGETNFFDVSQMAHSRSDAESFAAKRNRVKDTYHTLQAPLNFTLGATTKEFSDVEFMDFSSQPQSTQEVPPPAPGSNPKTEFQESTSDAIMFDFG